MRILRAVQINPNNYIHAAYTMGKKCIPGMFCIENMTLFVLFVLGVLLIYAFYKLYKITPPMRGGGGAAGAPIIINNNIDTAAGAQEFDNGIPPQNVLAGVSLPPIVGAGALMPIPTSAVTSTPVYGVGRTGYITTAVPINIETRPSSGYRYVQVGILERGTAAENGDILPLMGRRLTRNKWQYYAVSNTHLNIKLPVKIGGKSGSYEYGIDEVMNGDTVFVVGYGDYKVNVYESANYHYL